MIVNNHSSLKNTSNIGDPSGDRANISTASTHKVLRTPLYHLHGELGGKMVEFGGYQLPVQFAGVINEHDHCRSKASLFDVSHMGQAIIRAKDFNTAAQALEAVTPSNITRLNPGRMRYTVLLNDQGGIVDDLMVTRLEFSEDSLGDNQGQLLLVVNAGRKAVDYAYLENRLPKGVELKVMPRRSLLALQGPLAGKVIGDWLVPNLKFMTARRAVFDDKPVILSRAGYTGEDGFELSANNDDIVDIARQLLTHEAVSPAGLGARDILRLEAGFCLYGHDLDETTSPVEGALDFILSPDRLAKKNFPGAARIVSELENGSARRRVGFKLSERLIAREGVRINSIDGQDIGVITSGGFSPSLNASIAMGYVSGQWLGGGERLVKLIIRNRGILAEMVEIPFILPRSKNK